MSKSINLYIVRHGETLLNQLKRVQGIVDSPLTTKGRTQLLELGKGLETVKFNSAYCSNLKRTKTSAELILSKNVSSTLNCVSEINGLEEFCFGRFEASLDSDMWMEVASHLGCKDFIELYTKLFHIDGNFGIEILDTIHKLDTLNLAEDFSKVQLRALKALDKIVEFENAKTPNEDSNVLIVSHAFLILVMLYKFGGMNMLNENIKNASVCLLKYKNKEFTLEKMNDLSYVEQLN